MLLDYGLLNKICDKIKYLISKKTGITNSINRNFGKIMAFHNVIILIKSFVNKNESKYYYNIFLEKSS